MSDNYEVRLHPFMDNAEVASEIAESLSIKAEAWMTKKKVKSEQLVARVYPLLAEAIEAGVAYGLRRAYKYNDAPTRDELEEQVVREVLNAVMERFDVKEVGDEV